MIDLMLPALVAALVLVGIHAYLGLHIIARGVIFVDLALAQLAAMGATAATFLGFHGDSLATYSIGVAATILGAAIFSLSRFEHRYINQEAIIGIVFVVASAVTILLAAQAPRGSEHVQELLTGTLLWVTWPAIILAALIYAAVGLVHWFLRDRFFTISLEPEKADREGWSVRGWDFLFYALFGLVVTVSVSTAGVLLVFTFLVIPAVIAFLFTLNPRLLLPLAWSVGTLAATAGIVTSFFTDLPTGPTVVCAFGVALMLAFVVRKLIGGVSPGEGEPA
jgi:zinc/manganese transport system permease protein